MKVAALQKSAAETPHLFGGGEPVLVTRQGKISGLYVPLEDPDHLPSNLRRDLLTAVGRYVAELQEDMGVSEEEILEDVRAFRRRRR
ncbi:MAG: hypothetical protein ABJC13_01580 [Acidobacteriota bacterium]